MSVFAYLHFRTHKQWYFSQYITLQIFFLTSRTFSVMLESASSYESYLWILFRAFTGRELNGLFSQRHISDPMWEGRVRIGWYLKEITIVTEKKGPSFFCSSPSFFPFLLGKNLHTYMGNKSQSLHYQHQKKLIPQQCFSSVTLFVQRPMNDVKIMVLSEGC